MGARGLNLFQFHVHFGVGVPVQEIMDTPLVMFAAMAGAIDFSSGSRNQIEGVPTNMKSMWPSFS